jgi:hypothetical protein
LEVVSRADHTTLVKTSNQVNNDFVVSVVVDDLELTDVAMLLHQLKETNDDFAGWAYDDLSFASLLSVDDALEAISQHTHTHHIYQWFLQPSIG